MMDAMSMLQVKPSSTRFGSDEEASGPESRLIGALLAGLDWIAEGVALHDHLGEVVFSNASARLLDEATIESRASLTTAIQAACRRDERRLVELCVHGDPHFVTIAPVAFAATRWALVVHGRREICSPIELQMFSSRLGLTPAESQVLQRLSEGLRPAEIATANGVAITTVLSQVAALRAKTSTTSMQQMLRRVSRLPTMRARVESRPMAARPVSV